MAGLCKDCQHWFSDPFNEATGVCLMISCRTDHEASRPYDCVLTKARAMDREGFWLGHLHTDSDFGCNQFKEKTR